MLIQPVPMLLHDAHSALACVAAGFFQLSEKSGSNHSLYIYIYLFIFLCPLLQFIIMILSILTDI